MERILAVLAGSASLYAADVLSGLVDEAQQVDRPSTWARRELSDIALRLLADHTRTATFLVADGVVPSNEDRGYVLRRIIRRAVRFAYMLDVEQLVMPPMVERCIEIMGGAYPELVEQRSLVLDVIGREEERFRQTLARGSALLDTELDGRARGRARSTDGRVRAPRHVRVPARGDPGDGGPARRRRWTSTASRSAMAEQRERSRAAGKPTGVAAGDEVEAERAVLAEHGADGVHRTRGARVHGHGARRHR